MNNLFYNQQPVFFRAMEITDAKDEVELANALGISMHVMDKSIRLGIFQRVWTVDLFLKYNANIDYVLNGNLPKFIYRNTLTSNGLHKF